MISCKEATILTEKSFEGKLNVGDKFKLWLHRMICEGCRRYKVQSKWIDQALKKLDHKEHFHPKEKEELEQLIKSLD